MVLYVCYSPLVEAVDLFEVTWPRACPLDQNGRALPDIQGVIIAMGMVYRDAALALHLFTLTSNTYERNMVGENRQMPIDGIPIHYFGQLPALYAREFIYSLDTFLKCAQAISRMPDAPSAILGAINDFQQAFPRLIDVRDSAHHLEDRSQRKARNRPLNLQPVSNSAFEAPNGMLIIGAIRGRNYGTTIADGTYVEVEISEDSMNKFQAIYQSILAAFNWPINPFDAYRAQRE
jgi:hypothetical protein